MAMLGRKFGMFWGTHEDRRNHSGETPLSKAKLRVGQCTSVGNYRDNNEDRMHIDETRNLFIVADGMGGQAAGEQASQIAVDLIPRQLGTLSDETAADRKAVREALAEAFHKANQAILDRGVVDPTVSSMGTTAVMILLRSGIAYIAHIGDSRAYRFRQNKLEVITLDHNLAEALASSGTISKEEAKTHRFKNMLYRYLGSKDQNGEPDIKDFELAPNDRFLLASDGLTGVLDGDPLRKEMAKFDDPQACANHLVKVALERGSKDNVSCITIYVDEV